MIYRAGDTYHGKIFTTNPATGAAANADSALPVATASHNGTDDGSFALTVTNKATGEYDVSGVVPVGYVAFDTVNITATAIVGGLTGKSCIGSFTITNPLVLISGLIVSATALQIVVTITTASGIVSGGYLGRRLLFAATSSRPGFLTDPCNSHTVSGQVHTFGFAATQNEIGTAGDVVSVMGA